MREPAPETGWWLRIGRVLPDSVRERVYEPAIADLRLGSLDPSVRGRTVPLGLSVLLTLLGCLPVVVRWGLTNPGTISRRTRVVMVTVAVVVGVVVAVQQLTTVEAGY